MLVDVLDQHPELSPPITHMVRGYDISAEEPEYPSQAVIDDGGLASDVHFLRHVRRRVVDKDPLPNFGGSDAEPVVSQPRGDGFPDH
ncbi:hypothetical protein ATK86_7397 [Nocardia fluminea]|uniref:Uncharacterized protein n=1 Tax=Nocardia fluminea TaxID=134984 RepID=A0A2N3V4C8_9NOCA|nr:hypothetical protein ATK86_7397 [Nocardia fluminea]